MPEPLRISILGAAGITSLSLIAPAAAGLHEARSAV